MMMSLTLQERRIFLFLSFLLILGLSLRIFLKTRGEGNVCLSEWVTAQEPPVLLDINRASRQDWIALPGIGEKTADRIIAERERRGGFRSVEEIREIKGISTAKWERIKNSLSVK